MQNHNVKLKTSEFLLAVSAFSFCFFNFSNKADAAVCTYYASPTGGGNGLSQSSPFQITNFWSVAGPGKTLCLLDGAYANSSSNIDPPDNLSGSASAPITVRALNDGHVRIDGQNARYPILLLGNSYFVIEGVNVHNACSFCGAVVSLSSGANYNIIRRVIAWDSWDGNSEVFGIHNSNHNLLEDVAGFGVARKVFSFSQSGNDNTCRRCWGRWEGSTNVGPKDTFELIYNNYRNTYENIIGTWDGGSMPANYVLQNNGTVWTGIGAGTYANGDVAYDPYGIIAEGQPDLTSGTKVLGSIAYVKASDKFPAHGAYFLQAGGSGFEFTNNAAYFDPGSHTGTPAFFLPTNGTETDLTVQRLTSVGGAGNSIGSKWAQSNIESGADTSQVSSVYDVSKGAGICYRYENGVLTSRPLWPWLMDQRILDATTLAAASNHQHRTYQGNPPTLTLVTDPHEVANVTADIEAMFGSIPSLCRSDGNTSSSLLGDINQDSIVNSLDWSLMSAKWLTSDISADLNKDGSVNSLDWSVMSGNWLQSR